MQSPVTRYAPRPKTRVSDAQASAFNAELFQGIDPTARCFPTKPEAFAYMTANPTAQVGRSPLTVRQSEVVPPAADEPLPLVAQLRAC